jgi:hypothetical protein
MEAVQKWLILITRLDKPVILSLHLQRILFWKSCVFMLSILRKKKVAADIGRKFVPLKSSIEYMVEMPILAP